MNTNPFKASPDRMFAFYPTAHDRVIYRAQSSDAYMNGVENAVAANMMMNA